MMRSVLTQLLLLLSIVFVQSCSNIKVLNQADFYSAEFLKKIDSIQIIYRDGDKKRALSKLNQILDETITNAEKAKKYNLKGVMLFSQRDLDGAIENFHMAGRYVDQDLFLVNNIKLNLGSTYFKLNKIEMVSKSLKSIDIDYLKNKEKKSFHKLSFTVANQLNDYKTVVTSLIYLTKDLESFKEFDNFKFKEVLVDNFKKLDPSERVHTLDKNLKESPVVVAYLGKQEAMSRFYLGDREGSQDVVDWLAKKFDHLEDVKHFVEDYKYRVDNFSKINSGAVGVVAPLSGRLSKYGRKVVAGINTSISNNKSEQTLNVYVKDNQNNEFLARKKIQELVTKHHVSAIIGGLFPNLAKVEYLEARKYGVLYISLSPVYLPRSEKNYLLIEVPGSVESQIAGVLKPEILAHFGEKVAVLYPWSDEGKSYINEMWGLHNSEKIKLTNTNHYKKGISDYRNSVKSLLGLKYPRERKEEFKIWKDIKTVNKRHVRIVNILPPVVDFDWVFIPSIPKEAIQIMPTFGFFDAKGLKFVGGPSWINKKIQRQRKNMGGKIYVIGNDTESINIEFARLYKKHNGVNPHLVDTLSFESMNIVSTILNDQKFEKREDLGQRVLSFTELKGMTSLWKFVDGLWMKDMDVLKVGPNGFKKLDTTTL